MKYPALIKIACVGFGLALATVSHADMISINFAENSANQGFAGGELIGPFNSDSSNWNSTAGQPNLGFGNLTNLINDTGANTGAAMIWNSGGTFFNSEDGTGSDQSRLAVGYLDDGGSGIVVSISSIPYATYDIVGLYSSDQANGGTAAPVMAQDMAVDGTFVFGGGVSTSVSAYGSVSDNVAVNGVAWSPLSGTEVGNYWTYSHSGDSFTLTQSPSADPGRAALAGLIIVDTTVVPEPSTLGLVAIGLTILGLRRRVRC